MDFNNDKAIYLQIVEALQMDIITGVYKANEKLPSVRELSVYYRVNPNTMQRAFAELEGSGLVYTERTNGRFVSADVKCIELLKRNTASTAVKEFLIYMQRLGIQDEALIELIMDVRKDEEK